MVERPCPGFIAELLAHPVYSLASKINGEYFVAVARRRAVSTRALHWHALLVSIGVPQRLAVVCRGGLSALLVQRLICFGRERAVKRALKHATCVMSRRHFVGLKNCIPTCVSTLQGHRHAVWSVVFHPSAPRVGVTVPITCQHVIHDAASFHPGTLHQAKPSATGG